MPIHGYPGNVITANPTTPSVSSASGVWTTEQQLVNQAAGRWPMAQTQVSRSLRFNSADSTYLNRTPGSASNRKTWTWSGWVKRSSLGTSVLFSGVSSGNDATILRFTSDQLQLQNFVSGSFNGNLITTAVYRDVSAWYHIVAVWDSANATSGDRMRLYVNGSEVTVFSTDSAPTQNINGFINNTNGNYLGVDSGFNNQYFNGYLTEVNFIDGLALDPSYFGFNDSNTGVWTPRQYTGAYGTNGFYLNFSDNSGTTSTTLGKDYSGNGNNWTPNNFSVTAGAGNDSLVDTPTSYGTDTGAGGEVRGNYCTFNPVNVNSSLSCTNGNLTTASSAADTVYRVGFATMAMKSPTYFECTLEGITNYGVIGIGPQISVSTNTYVGSSTWANSVGFLWGTGDTVVYYNSTNLYTLAAAPAANSVIQFAYDPSTGKVWVGKDGTWYNSGSPSTGANPIATISTSVDIFPASAQRNTGNTTSWNFGQRAFAYTAPSGFKALCTQNLPTPTIGATSTTQANDYFDATLYTGNGASPRNVTGLAFQPDWVWVKNRTGTWAHQLFDSVRGAGLTKALTSNGTDAEGTYGAWGYLSSFNSDGFTLTAGGTSNDQMNKNAETYVAWNWNAGGSTVTNTSGTISAQVRASTTAGFSIATYTGNGSAGATVGHGLGVTPSMIFVKSRSVGTAGWVVWHTSLTLGANSYLVLEGTQAQQTTNQPWNNTLPTSSVFSLRTWDAVNQNGSTYVAYCFAAVAGYSAFGSYTGNGSADGPFVYTGFRPRYIVIKMSSGVEDWRVFDTARSTYNIQGATLYPNTSSAENSSQLLDINSNGFKCRTSDIAVNGSGSTYIYFSFAENPFKYSIAR